MIILSNRFKQIHFEKLSSQSGWNINSIAEHIEILKDLDTGVLYCLATCGSNIAMTPLLDSNGNPIIDKSE